MDQSHLIKPGQHYRLLPDLELTELCQTTLLTWRLTDEKHASASLACFAPGKAAALYSYKHGFAHIAVSLLGFSLPA